MIGESEMRFFDLFKIPQSQLKRNEEKEEKEERRKTRQETMKKFRETHKIGDSYDYMGVDLVVIKVGEMLASQQIPVYSIVFNYTDKNKIIREFKYYSNGHLPEELFNKYKTTRELNEIERKNKRF